MLPISRVYLETASEISFGASRYLLQPPSDRFQKSFGDICYLQDRGQYARATGAARRLSGDGHRQRRLAQMLLSSVQLFTEGSVKQTVSTCSSLEPAVAQLLQQGCSKIAPVDVSEQASYSQHFGTQSLTDLNASVSTHIPLVSHPRRDPFTPFRSCRHRRNTGFHCHGPRSPSNV